MAGISALPITGGVVLRVVSGTTVVIAELNDDEAVEVGRHLMRAILESRKERNSLAALAASLVLTRPTRAGGTR